MVVIARPAGAAGLMGSYTGTVRSGTSSASLRTGATIASRKASTSPSGPKRRRSGRSSRGGGTGSATVSTVSGSRSRRAHASPIGTRAAEAGVSSTQVTTSAPSGRSPTRGPARMRGSWPRATTSLATDPTRATERPRPWVAMHATAEPRCLGPGGWLRPGRGRRPRSAAPHVRARRRAAQPLAPLTCWTRCVVDYLFASAEKTSSRLRMTRTRWSRRTASWIVRPLFWSSHRPMPSPFGSMTPASRTRPSP
jgi:hypothetical protein